MFSLAVLKLVASVSLFAFVHRIAIALNFASDWPALVLVAVQSIGAGFSAYNAHRLDHVRTSQKLIEASLSATAVAAAAMANASASKFPILNGKEVN
jgi:hypothetical protein